MTGADDGRAITAFRVGDDYLFKRYFEREDLFARLRDHYVPDEYRFEVSADDLDAVRTTLEAEGYALRTVEDLEPYCVVTGEYEPHAEILRRSVASWTRRGYRFFLLPDALAVAEAEEHGATPVAGTDLVVGL